jgi:transcription termination factor Rho
MIAAAPMAVLKRNELEESPLADLHVLAAELGMEGFRRLRKGELIDLMLGEPGGGDSDGDDSGDDASEKKERAPRSGSGGGSGTGGGRRRGGRGGGGGGGGGRGRGGQGAAKDAGPKDDIAADDDGGDDEANAETRSGTLDVLSNGSGFLRADPFSTAKEDVYVSPAQVRRCELRAGDTVEGPVRPPRRSERYPSLIRVATVNGADADKSTDRPRFEDLKPIFAKKKLDGPKDAPAYGYGSRVVVSGPPGAGASTLLLEAAKSLAKASDITLTVVLAGVRPEEMPEWKAELGDTPILGGSFDEAQESHVDAARVAGELAKRAAERGEHSAIVIDSVDALPDGAGRRLLATARNTEEGGSVTVIAASSDPRGQRLATTRIVLQPGGKVDADASGTLRADQLK